MKKLIIGCMGFILANTVKVTYAGGAPLFTASASGTNGITVNTTVTPRKNAFYYAGIRSNTSGVSFLGCDNDAASGLCKFNVNQSYSPPNLSYQGLSTESNNLRVVLCLNGNTQGVNCEQHTLSLPSFAYVINYTSNLVLLCDVAANGLLDNCTNAGGNGGADLRQIVINQAGTTAYLVEENSSNVVAACPIEASGTLSSSCQITSFVTPRAIAFTSDQRYAYVTDNNGGSGVIARCAVNATNGALESCNNVITGLSVPTGIDLHTFSTGSLTGSYVYYAQASSASSITYCRVNSSTGALQSCQVTATGGATITSPEAITLNPTGTFAYITSAGTGNIVYCAVNQTTGALEDCSNTANGLVSANTRGGVTFSPNGQQAYFGSFNNDIVYFCNVLQNGALSGCTNSGASTLNNPSGVALVHYPTIS